MCRNPTPTPTLVQLYFANLQVISGSSQGQGIFLINSAHDIPSAHKEELMAQRLNPRNLIVSIDPIFPGITYPLFPGTWICRT